MNIKAKKMVTVTAIETTEGDILLVLPSSTPKHIDILSVKDNNPTISTIPKQTILDNSTHNIPYSLEAGKIDMRLETLLRH